MCVISCAKYDDEQMFHSAGVPTTRASYSGKHPTATMLRHSNCSFDLKKMQCNSIHRCWDNSGAIHFVTNALNRACL